MAFRGQRNATEGVPYRISAGGSVTLVSLRFQALSSATKRFSGNQAVGRGITPIDRHISQSVEKCSPVGFPRGPQSCLSLGRDRAAHLPFDCAFR